MLPQDTAVTGKRKGGNYFLKSHRKMVLSIEFFPNPFPGGKVLTQITEI